MSVQLAAANIDQFTHTAMYRTHTLQPAQWETLRNTLVHS